MTEREIIIKFIHETTLQKTTIAVENGPSIDYLPMKMVVSIAILVDRRVPLTKQAVYFPIVVLRPDFWHVQVASFVKNASSSACNGWFIETSRSGSVKIPHKRS